MNAIRSVIQFINSALDSPKRRHARRERRLRFESVEARTFLSASPFVVQTSLLDIPPALTVKQIDLPTVPVKQIELPTVPSPPNSQTPFFKVIDPNLSAMRLEISSAASKGVTNFSSLSTLFVRVDAEGKIQVYAFVKAVTPQEIKALIAAGLQVETSNADMHVVQGWIPYRSLPDLALVPGVAQVTPPGYAEYNSGYQPGAVDSDGQEGGIRPFATASPVYGPTYNL